MANWSGLPLEILCLFAERLPPCLEDAVRFSGVCQSWRSAATHVNKRLSAWLMLAESRSDNPMEPQGATRRCYSLSTGQMFNLQLPELQGRRCWGTNYGWLVAYGGLDLDMFLFNPLNRAKIPLLPPPLNVSPQQMSSTNRKHALQFYVKKVAISWDTPGSKPSVMMLMSDPRLSYASREYTSQLCFASPGHDNWKVIQTPGGLVEDVVFFKDHFYCIVQGGLLRICGSNSTEDVAPPPTHPEFDGCGTFYLVEISGDLYLINRNYQDDLHGVFEELTRFYHPQLLMDPNPPPRRPKYNQVTESFRAFKFDFQQKKWSCCLKHLQGYAVFVGNNAGFAISTSEYPQFKPNCIYFTDDYSVSFQSSSSDMGIYDYEKHAVIGSFDNCVHEPSWFSRSVFFTPLQPNLH